MYRVVWSFEVLPAEVAAFERVYGPGGEWARLFQRGDGYLGTELLRDVAEPSRYVTVDRWRRRRDLERFRERFAAEYRALDERSERLTMHEVLIGEFESKEES